MAWNVII